MDFSWLADPFYQEYLLEGFVRCGLADRCSACRKQHDGVRGRGVAINRDAVKARICVARGDLLALFRR